MKAPESKPEPEIRGGDRPADYIPEVPHVTVMAGLASAAGGVPSSCDCCEWTDDEQDGEPPGANDPEAQ
jgi:hypothetical protein